ncbi:MAG: ABC-type transport auxiliary lipoprotein family protein [Amaricoccus sp.]|uniref:PqiC family protein n=1 Tax=Amaricoccus sp. TaxID=1872485 RepID=UPI0039E29F06
MTRHLAAALEARLATHVVTDPWPGYEFPGLRIEVAVDRLVGASGGGVELAGQYVLLDPQSGRITGADRFAITVPSQGEGFPGLMAGEARAIEALADRLADRITRRGARPVS